MRDDIVFGIVVIISIAAILRPQIGLLGYVWFGLMRPDIMAYSGSNKYSMLIAICTLIGSIRYLPGIIRIFRNPYSTAFVLLQVPIAISVIAAPDPDLSMLKYIPFLSMSLMVLLQPVLMEQYRDLKLFFLVMAFSIGMVGMKFGLWGVLMGGVRFTQGLGGFHSDNNTMALGLTMALPLCWYSIPLVKQVWLKAMYVGLTFGCIAAIVMTHSRAGILATAVVLLVFVLRSKKKMLAVALLALLTLPSLALVWDSVSNRLATLENPLEEGSAANRFRLNMAALQMIPKYWLFGVGFGADNFAFRVGIDTDFPNERLHVAHNNYLQMWVDSGTGAFLIFCFMLFGSIRYTWKQRKRFEHENSEWAAIATGLEISLIGFAVGSIFASRTNYDFIYILIVMAGCCYNYWAIAAPESPRMMQMSPELMMPAPAPQATPEPQPAMGREPLRSGGLGRALRAAGRMPNDRRA